MSLYKEFNELEKTGTVAERLRKARNVKQKEKVTTYQPLFMLPVKRTGVFLMTEKTYNDESYNCLSHLGYSLEKYLWENNLKIEKVRMGWKISVGG